MQKFVTPKKKKPTNKIVLPVIALLLLIVVASSSMYFVTMKMSTDLTIWEMFHNFASPSLRYIKITEGMRKEEVADRFAKTLGWTETEKQKLLAMHTVAMKGKTEGYYYPDTYLISSKAKAPEVSKVIAAAFEEEIIQKQEKTKNGVINMDTAVKIASIIQREAYDKNDMNIISGVIWNRLFKGMTLDMDATLQYAKGKDGKWWPQVRPEDKKINSPYNTYKNKGLPPSAISNPGEAAIAAALNPAKTSALFYIHDANGRIHTAVTYEDHVANINTYLK
jgi:UPF0755 protein